MSRIGVKENGVDINNIPEQTSEIEDDVDDENLKIQEAEEIIALQSKKMEVCQRKTEVRTIIGQILDALVGDVIENSSLPAWSDNTKAPFAFSDFASQPNRPFSPNLSDNSDSDEKLEMKPDGEVQNIKKEEQKESQSPTKEKQVINYSIIMDEYKSRKSLHTLPPQKSVRKNPFIKKHQTSHSRHPVDPEIEQQRTASLKKDAEAKISLYTDLVCLTLNLVAELNDEEFKVLKEFAFDKSLLTICR